VVSSCGVTPVAGEPGVFIDDATGERIELRDRPHPLPLFALHQGDATAWLQSLPPKSASMGFFDPAYESLEKHRAKGTTTRLKKSDASSNEWFEIFKNERFPEHFAEWYRVLDKDAHLYVMCDQETMFAIKPMGEAAGFKFWKPVIWHKTGRIGMGYHYRCCYEVVLFFEKGKRKLNDLGMPDVLACDRVYNGYPTEKPVPLIQKFIAQSTEPGELVLDPFMGSGSTGEAALRLGRHFGGNDLSAKSVEIVKKRLAPLGTRWGA
jgi:site-specific DNA-methyltransferase (adenine-specific)